MTDVTTLGVNNDADIDENGWLRAPAADQTANLVAVFQMGIPLYFPPGNYYIKAQGPNTGGVAVSWTKSIFVVCHPNARFFTDGVDNDLIRFIPPSNGADIPAEGLDFYWSGGIIDQRWQKVSTAVPSGGPQKYPPAPDKAGTSATCDGLSLRPSYTDAGGVSHDVGGKCCVNGVLFQGCNPGGDWFDTTKADFPGGGDSGILVGGGFSSAVVERCRFIGSRDLGIYGSNDTAANALPSNQIFINNVFEGAFGGIAFKRSIQSGRASGNEFRRTVICIQTSRIVGNGDRSIIVSENHATNCEVFCRVSTTSNFVGSNNINVNGGCIVNGAPIMVYNPPAATPVMFWLKGCTGGIFHHNQFSGLDANFAKGSTAMFVVEGEDEDEDETDTVPLIPSTNNIIDMNFCDGLHNLGNCNSAQESSNRFLSNQAVNTDNAFFMSPNVTDIEIRVDPASRQPIVMKATQFTDGSAAAAPIARRGQANVGIFFDTNKVGLSANGNEVSSAIYNATTGAAGMRFRNLVEPTATGRTVAIEDSGTIFSNAGALARTDFTLPQAASGLTVTLYCADADGIRGIAVGNDVIELGPGLVSAVAGRIDSTTVGSSVVLVAVSSTRWHALSVVGSWAVT